MGAEYLEGIDSGQADRRGVWCSDVTPDPAGNFSFDARSPKSMRRAIERILAESPDITPQRLAAKLRVLVDDEVFTKALEDVETREG